MAKESHHLFVLSAAQIRRGRSAEVRSASVRLRQAPHASSTRITTESAVSAASSSLASSVEIPQQASIMIDWPWSISKHVDAVGLFITERTCIVICTCISDTLNCLLSLPAPVSMVWQSIASGCAADSCSPHAEARRETTIRLDPFRYMSSCSRVKLGDMNLMYCISCSRVPVLR